MFYSNTTKGFYTRELHGDKIPADAVEITTAEHQALLDGQSAGKIIGVDASGRPVLQDAPKESTRDVWLKIKAKRDERSDSGGYPVVVGGVTKWFHSDLKSRTQQASLVLMGEDMEAGIHWKTMDGSFVEMTPAIARAIFASSSAQERATFEAAETHKTAMLASATPWDYDYSAGWPPVYGE